MAQLSTSEALDSFRTRFACMFPDFVVNLTWNAENDRLAMAQLSHSHTCFMIDVKLVMEITSCYIHSHLPCTKRSFVMSALRVTAAR
jgi:hypothetical protein